MPPATHILDKVQDPLLVSFKGLSYKIVIKKCKIKTEKHILKDVDGIFRPGRMTMIMGASGAGKTSLLNVVAGKVCSGVTSGAVLVNGNEVGPRRMRHLSGFVHQDDLILETMTVREAVLMSARLRLPESIPAAEKLARVDETIAMLGLEKAANTIIGSAQKKGISGGERKRTSLAMEMVANPSILFLDEPTSGLDTFTAYSVCKCLSNLARQGRTIITTIHQPSSEIFHLFDDLILLADGQMVYNGPVEAAVSYFAKLHFICPRYTNPADFIFMSILNCDGEDIEEGNGKSMSAQERKDYLILEWKKSEENSNFKDNLEKTERRELLAKKTRAKSSFLTQFSFLFFRAGKNALRNKMMIAARFYQSLFLAFIISAIFYDLNSRKLEPQVQDRTGCLFFITVNMFMMSAMSVISIFANEKHVFIREYGSRYYSLPAYFLSKIFVELPYQVLFPLIMIAIEYWIIGFQPEFSNFAVLCLNSILVSLCGIGYGTLAACIFPDFTIAMAVFPIILLPLMMFSGMMVNTESIPVYFNWIKYISPMKYGFATSMKNEFTGLVFKNCFPADSPHCRGEFILERMNLKDGFSIEMNSILLSVIYLVLMLLSYLTLFRITRKH